MKRVAVILSGCGVFDGTEIHEAVLTLLYLDKHGAEVQCFAPDEDQLQVINHATQEIAETEKRNVLVESARIARGPVTPLNNLDMGLFDAVIFPGGFGAAKNLCTFAVEGINGSINDEIARIIEDAHLGGKVIGAMCIAPVLVAQAFKNTDVKPRLTIGIDQDTSEALSKLNAEPITAKVDDIVIDDRNKIVTTPAYMLGSNIAEIAVGIEKLINEVIRMA